MTYNNFTSSYRLKTPNRTTASFAYIFGKRGLLSVDAIFKDYTKLKFKDDTNYFNDVNPIFKKHYKHSIALRAGTEWRFQ